jgi:hypothetical protein
MKFLKFAVVALLLSTAIFSCSKDKDDDFKAPAGNTSIEGKYVGKYGYGNEEPSISYILNVKPGGIIEELNTSGVSKCVSGNWNLTGNTFKAKYQWKAPLNSIFSIAATFDPSTGKLTGTWGYGDNATNGGKWETKQ